jgi:hypothetical protein
MATDEKKAANRARVAEYTLVGLAAALWEMVGESSMALAAPIGEQILKLTEKEMGLEIAGETPQAVLTEVARLLADEFGYCKEVRLEEKGDMLTLYAKDCVTSNMPRQLKEAGVDKYYISPGLLLSLAALKRLGVKARGESIPWPEGHGIMVKLQVVP